MAYLGKAPINGFHAKQTLTGDGSTTSFALDQTVATETSIIVSVGGVIQEPGTAYNLTIGGTKIDFTAAPVSTDRVYVQFLGTAIVQNLLDVNGAEFVLDANGNTSFTADTDDEIDIKVGGTDRSTIKATGFHNIDSVKFVAGTGDDLQLYHDGSNSYISDQGTGGLYNLTSYFRVNNAANNKSMIHAEDEDGVDLYFNNSKKFETTAVGVTVTGTIIATTDTDTSNTGNVTLDFAANQNFVLTLTGNTTLVNPSTEQVGQSGFIAFIQDGTGGRTITLGTDYETAGGLGITLTAAASKTDLVPYVVVAAGRILLGQPQKNFS